MIVLGIDPASINIGYALIEFLEEYNLFLCKESGVLKLNKKDSINKRLITIHTEINKLVTRLATDYKIDKIGIELTLSNVNAKSSLDLAMSRGAIISSFGENINTDDIIDINPKTVKLLVTGDGNADKKKVADFIKIIYGKTCPLFKTYDESDALGIAFSTIQKQRGKLKWQ